MPVAVVAVSMVNGDIPLVIQAQARRAEVMARLNKLAQQHPVTMVWLPQTTQAQAVAAAATLSMVARVARVLLSSAIWALQQVPVAR